MLASKIIGRYRNIGYLLALVFLVFNSNTAELKAQSEGYMDVTSTDVIKTIASIAPYTSFVDEDLLRLETTLASDNAGFIEKPSVDIALKTPTIYTVQKGDSIVSISRKFNISVATILDANKLASTASLKQGTTITIPPYSTNDSLAWLDEINVEKAKQEAQRQRLLAEQKRKLALLDKRSVKYRETSSTRSSINGEYTGAGESGMIVPISSKGISRGLSRYHTGIDYRADVGTPVMAAKSGTVIEITGGWAGGWGNSILLSHGNGVTTRYAHLSKIGVSLGQTVSQGSILGYSGSTGFSTGPHLHFEERINNQAVYPF